ncbi:MAG: hypothetical protein M3071_21265 [Actinomycetota bacterium]|nr:hypothetical protein [Actinomycetota bacterium]
MRGTVVDDHEDAPGLAVRLDGHELVHELVERDDLVLLIAAVEQFRAAYVPRREITQRTASLVLVLDALTTRDAGLGRQRCVPAVPVLDRGFLVAADDVVTGMQQLAFPAAGVEIEDPGGFGGELGVAREDPGAVLPRLDRVL